MAKLNETTNEVIIGLTDEVVIGDEQQVWGAEKSLDWRLAWQRAVSKAWGLPEYKEKLLKHPHEALADVGWTVPKGLKIKIEAVPEGSVTWDSEVHTHRIVRDGKQVVANGWAYSLELHPKKNGASEVTLHDNRVKLLDALQTTVILKLPPKPNETELLPLASADYDGLSRAYPFTSCLTC